jgi:hypothetical protein
VADELPRPARRFTAGAKLEHVDDVVDLLGAWAA